MTSLARPNSQEHGSGLWTADQFLEFYMTRPEGERWQLVDGLAMMVAPPTVRHRRIGKNLLRLIDAAIDVNAPDLICLYGLGLRVRGIVDFSPAPDLVVVPTDGGFGRYADSFRLVVEITSPLNTAELIECKLELYRSQPDNLYCMTIDQDSVHVALWARGDGWTKTDLRSLDDVLRLPAFGLEAPLAAIYRGTPLGR